MEKSISTRQFEMINKVTELLREYDTVEVVFLIGSFAKGENTPFSDIDIEFISTDPTRPHREEIFERVMNLAPSLSALWLYDKNGLFLYEDGVRLDLDFLTINDLAGRDLSKGKVLLDPSGKYQALHEQTFAAQLSPKPSWRAADGDMFEWFFWMFRQTYCYIKRAEGDEKRRFNKLYKAQQSMMQVRDKLIEIKEYTHGEWQYMRTLDVNFADAIGNTFCHFQPKEMLCATRKLFAIFKMTLPSYCEKENIPVPAHQIRVMERLFDVFDNEN